MHLIFFVLCVFDLVLAALNVVEFGWKVTHFDFQKKMFCEFILRKIQGL